MPRECNLSYCDFIDNFSKLADSLTQLTRKSAAFVWGKDEEKSFQQLKELFILAPILAHWDPDRNTVLKCDCSGYALGETLSQFDNKRQLRPVAYFSQKLTQAKCYYEIHDKELLAIIKSVEYWQRELRSLASPFQVLTDDKNMRYFMTA
jgi:hypothetical protein